MTAQLVLFPAAAEPADTAADPIEQQLARSIARGQRITDWVRTVMRAWAARDVRPDPADPSTVNPGNLTWLQLGVVPIPCDCARCGEPSLIFPPEPGAPQGYCICPKCSAPGAAVAESAHG